MRSHRAVVDSSLHLEKKLQYLDKSLILERTKYDIVGAVYGDDEHFTFRHILGDNIYEADGMHLHELKVPEIL